MSNPLTQNKTAKDIIKAKGLNSPDTAKYDPNGANDSPNPRNK